MKWWFAQNVVCYVTPSALERLPGLARRRCATAPLPLVHPGCLERYVEELARAERRGRATDARALRGAGAESAQRRSLFDSMSNHIAKSVN